MRNILYSFLLTSIPIASFSNNVDSENQKPNLIFVFTDQHSFDMLGCYGNKEIKTPNIDRLASKGVLFNHCISSCPVSTPYRSMLLTGLHPLNNGALLNDVRIIESKNRNYFGEVLTDAGYHTGYYGKWHLYGGDRDRAVPSGPYRYGFDDEFLTNNCTMLYDSIRSYFWNEKGEKELYGDWEWNVQTKQAIGFINKYGKNHEKPFAMFLSWHAPHDWMAGGVREHKYSAPREYEALYNPDKISLRENCKDTRKHREYYQGHMAMISNLDQNFGEIMKALEENGALENSLIIFTADHGDMLESHDWIHNKGCPEIESIRVPLIMYYGSKLRHRKSELLIGSLDIMPTILGLLDIKVPKECQGKDLSKAIIKEKDNSVKSVPLFYFTGNWRGVYTHDYTYAFTIDGGAAEAHVVKAGFKNNNVLYSHKNDPRELNNLFDNEDYLKIKNELHKETLGWMRKFNDKGRLFNEVWPKFVNKEDLEVMKIPIQKRPKGFETRLIGRPVDFQ